MGYSKGTDGRRAHLLEIKAPDCKPNLQKVPMQGKNESRVQQSLILALTNSRRHKALGYLVPSAMRGHATIKETMI